MHHGAVGLVLTTELIERCSQLSQLVGQIAPGARPGIPVKADRAAARRCSLRAKSSPQHSPGTVVRKDAVTALVVTLDVLELRRGLTGRGGLRSPNTCGCRR